MGKFIEKTGKTVDLAVSEALSELNVSAEEVEIEILDEGESGGLLGFGKKPARIRVYYKHDVEADTELSAETETLDTTEQLDSDTAEVNLSAAEEESNIEKAENAALDYLQEVLGGLGLHGRISTWLDDDNSLHIEVEGEGLGTAIGRRGETLNAIQYLTNLVANTNTSDHVRVLVDVAGYRQRQNKKLRDLALRSADRCLDEKRRIRLKPMNPAERREVHLALADYQGVATWSEGYEPVRYIVIAPENKDNPSPEKEDFWDDDEDYN